MTDVEREKRLAAETAAELVRDGMRVGLGTGTTVTYLLDALAHRAPRVSYVATSPWTHNAAIARGLVIEEFDRLDRLDIAVDGADQIGQNGWLVKGGGGAHTREKIVAASADRFVVIVDSSKRVEVLRGPVPVELSAFGLASTLRRLATAVVRDEEPSPDGGVLVDYECDLADPVVVARTLSSTPGVVAHGLFEPELISEVIVGVGDDVVKEIREAAR